MRPHVFSQSLAALLLTTAIMIPSATRLTAQPPSAPAPDVDLLQPDTVISRDTKLVREGEIRFATDNGIDLKEKKKLAVLLSADEYQIQFWNGVTNAAEVLAAAHRQVALIQDALDQHRFEDADLSTVKASIEIADKKATALFDAIHVFTKDDISRLPEIPELSRDDIDALQAAAIDREALHDLDDQIMQAAEDRQEVQALQRSQLRLILLGLKVRRFQDAALQCQRIAMQMTSLTQPSAMQRQFGEAANTLHRLCEQFQITGQFVAKLPPLINLRLLTEATQQLLPELEDMRDLRILGPDVAELLDAIRQEHLMLDNNVKQMALLAAPLQNIQREWQRLGDSAEQASFASLEEFTTQYTQIESSLKTLVTSLQPNRDQPATSAILAEAGVLQRELEDNRESLALQVELPFVEDLLKEARKVSTDVEARAMASMLDRQYMEMSKYLTPGQRIPPQSRRRLDLVLTALKSTAARCRNDALQIITDSTSASLDSIRKSTGALILQATDTKENDKTDFVTALSELQQAVIGLSDEFTKACEREPELPEGAVQLQAGIKGLRSDIDQGLRLLQIRQAHQEPLPRQSTTAEVDTLTLAVSTSRQQLASLKLRPTGNLQELHSAIDVLVRSRALELQMYRTRIDTDLAVSTLSSQFDEVKANLLRGETKRAGATLFGASRAYNELLSTISSNKTLANDPHRTQELELLRTRLDGLTAELSVHRRQDRAQAGWLTLADDQDTQVPPSNENRWLEIEVLVSRRLFSDASTKLAAMTSSLTDPASRQRAAALNATIQLLQARFAEANGNTLSALAQFQALAESDGPAAQAATIAALSLSQQIKEKTDSSGLLVRVTTAAVFVAAICLFCVFLVRRESLPGRMKRTRATLASYRTQDLRNAATAAATREKVAVLLASLPENDAETRQIQADLSIGHLKGLDVVIPPLPSDGIPVPAPALPRQVDFIEDIVALEALPDEQSVQELINWLASSGSEEKVARQTRRSVIQWLKNQLSPDQQDLPTTLQIKARLAAQCRKQATKADPWPLLYELRALLMVADWHSALALAKAIPLKGTHQTLVVESVVAVARCHVEMQQWKETLDWCKHVRQRMRKRTPNELNHWMAIATGKRVIASSHPPDPQLLAQFANAMTGHPPG